MKIAIIGGGISGLGAAYLLQSLGDITVYEKNDYVGGHSRTIDVKEDHCMQAVDTGFIVFNDWNYPHLMALFDRLGVAYEKSDMSFGVCINGGEIEYSSNNLFAQKRNFLRPKFWGMIFDILRFNWLSRKYISDDNDMTLNQLLDRLNMGAWFRRYYLLAMGAAIWSCPVKAMMDFPARRFLRFFKNHGLLNIFKRPQWYTVTGGSREYVSKLKEALSADIQLSRRAIKIHPDKDGRGYWVESENGVKNLYDHVVFACHADEALEVIENPTQDEREVLGAFGYQKNRVVTHCDDRFMPRERACWASWVYLNNAGDSLLGEDIKPQLALSYWMNNLQNFETQNPVLVTLNPENDPPADKIYDVHEFSHPIFDDKAVRAQDRIGQINGSRNLWFCGAYQRYGFHEDGLWSAVRVAELMGASIPWKE